MAITNTPPPRPGMQVGLNTGDGPKRRVVDMRSIGSQGLRQYSGQIFEEPLKELKGARALEEFKAMSLNDATCSAIVYAIDKLVRQVPWTIAQASQEPFDLEAADFLSSCFDDMDYPFHEVLSEIVCGMLIYGHSLHEVVFKRRAGDSPEAQLNSAYDDGYIGWRDFAVRSQDTIYRWIYDTNGRLMGAEQMAPPDNKMVYLPLDKCLLFRTSSEKGSPLGKSIFRGAYRSWSIKTSLENIEAVGVEKDLVGIPVVKIPIELIQLAEADDEEAMAIVEAYKTLATNLRRNHQEGVVMGTSYDENNNSQFDLSLLLFSS
ncbi:MAG: hypothetical protein EOO40_01005 [Deltaproteobacteria bacterium]|nr:MAG: hypothetical protein EOO40_01005 [Deltaproteobacteria bacterium]